MDRICDQHHVAQPFVDEVDRDVDLSEDLLPAQSGHALLLQSEVSGHQRLNGCQSQTLEFKADLVLRFTTQVSKVHPNY